jgi:hypothetical protein
VLDRVSGAHTAGSRLSAVLLAGRARLAAPFLDFLRKEYHRVYERDGIVALGPVARGWTEVRHLGGRSAEGKLLRGRRWASVYERGPDEGKLWAGGRAWEFTEQAGRGGE